MNRNLSILPCGTLPNEFRPEVVPGPSRSRDQALIFARTPGSGSGEDDGVDSEALRALVVDDDPFSCTFVAAYVQELGYETVVAHNGADAITAAAEVDLDLAILDLDLGPGINGIEVAQAIRQTQSWVALVLLTGHRAIDLVEQEVPIPRANFVHLVKSDLRDSRLLDQAISDAIEGVSRTTTVDGQVQLSKSQAELLKLVAQGWSNDEIANRRQCSVRAVESLLRSMYANLGISRDNVRNQRVAAAMMYRDGGVTVR